MWRREIWKTETKVELEDGGLTELWATKGDQEDWERSGRQQIDDILQRLMTPGSLIMAVNTLPTGGRTRHDQYVLGAFHSRDLLIWLKDLALEPSNMESSCHRLRNQMLKVRKLMNANDAKSSQKKRNFEQYMDYGKFAGTFELEKYSSQLVEKQRRCESSCLPLSKEKCGTLQGTQGHVAFHAINDKLDKLEYCCVCSQDYSHLSDYDESIKGSNQVKQGNLKSHCERFENGSGYTPSLKAPIKEELNIEMFKELRSLVNEDFDDSCKNSYSLRLGKENRKLDRLHKKGRQEIGSGKEDRKLDQSHKKFLPFRGNHLSRLVIPIGPRFQAEIPQWESTTNIRHHNIDDDFKWFGTEIWPMPIKETSTKGVGEGRPDVCSCDFPRSIDCVQQHISEARELLQSEIGTTFSSWKFDEMGEDVSKSWTMEEQKEFEYIVRLNPLSSDMDFWKLAMDYFPSKPLMSMVNYYYNVYIPRHMSKETRASFGVVDNVNDKIMDYKNGDDYGKMTIKQLFEL